METNNKMGLNIPEGYERRPLKGMRKWVDSLRSGVYVQGKGRLEKNGRFCCLGVYCHLFAKDEREEYDDGEITYGRYRDTLSPEISPKNLGSLGDFPGRVFYGYDSKNGNKTYKNLVDCNDRLDLSFTEIADIIEQIWYDEDEGI